MGAAPQKDIGPVEDQESQADVLLTATIGGSKFTLRASPGGYSWYYSGGSPTDICAITIDEARRRMMFRAAGLAGGGALTNTCLAGAIDRSP